MARTPTDPTKAQVWVTKGLDELDFEFYFPQGPKGDPGGFGASTLLATSNLNDIKVAGLYRQDGGGNATLVANYPAAGSAGVLIVTEMAGLNYLVQEWHPLYGDSRGARVFYKREFTTPNWSPWRSFVSARVDQTAGRAIYQWDDLNGREQIIYGDTGWRLISPPVVPTKVDSGTAQIRRIGSNVYLRFVDVVLSSAATGYCPIFTSTDIPVNFRPFGAERTMQNVGQVNNALAQQVISIFGEVAWARQVDNAAVSLTRPTAGLKGTVQWLTDDAWPTTLPGTAVGSIPNL